MNLPRTPATLWTERYETIRRHFVANRALLSVEPLGLALLRDNGLAEWMHRWHLDPATTPKPLAPSLPEPPALPIIPCCQQELTQLVAHMTAQHLQPIHT
jgi:hypothetical protein